VTVRCLIVEDQVMFLQPLCKMLQGLPALKPVANSAQMP
jgi:hypothetical protein